MNAVVTVYRDNALALTPSNEQKRTDRGITSPPRLSLVIKLRDGRAKIRTLMSVHIPTAAKLLYSRLSPTGLMSKQEISYSN
jgi:hypothetical protein